MKRGAASLTFLYFSSSLYMLAYLSRCWRSLLKWGRYFRRYFPISPTPKTDMHDAAAISKIFAAAAHKMTHRRHGGREGDAMILTDALRRTTRSLKSAMPTKIFFCTRCYIEGFSAPAWAPFILNHFVARLIFLDLTGKTSRPFQCNFAVMRFWRNADECAQILVRYPQKIQASRH